MWRTVQTSGDLACQLFDCRSTVLTWLQLFLPLLFVYFFDLLRVQFALCVVSGGLELFTYLTFRTMKRRFVLVDESDEVIQAFKSRTPSSSLLNVDVVNDCVSFSSYSFAVHVFPLFVELAIGYVPSFFLTNSIIFSSSGCQAHSHVEKSWLSYMMRPQCVSNKLRILTTTTLLTS